MTVNMAPIDIQLPGWMEYDKAIERVFNVLLIDLTTQTWKASLQRRSGNSPTPVINFTVATVQTSFNGTACTQFTMGLVDSQAALVSNGEYSWDMQDVAGFTWFKGSLKITRHTTVV